MKKILFFFLLLPHILGADIIEVKNSRLQQEGITSQSLEAWLTPQLREQSYDGEHYLNLLGSQLVWGNGVRIFPHSYDSNKPPLFRIYVNMSTLSPDFTDDFEYKYVVKILPRSTYENTNYQNEKPNQDEITRIQKASKFLEDEKFRTNCPLIGKPLGHYKVDCRDMNTYYFSIYPVAKGFSLKHYLSSSTTRDGKAFELLGQKLAGLHLAQMDFNTAYAGEDLSTHIDRGFWQRCAYYKTFIHGDLHLGNIFYAPEAEEITLIDIETMGYSVDQKHSIMRDIEAVIFRYFLYENGFDAEIPDLEEIYSVCITSFLKAYINAYPSQMQEDLKTYLCTMLTDHRVTSQITPHFKYILPKLNAANLERFNDIILNIKKNLRDS